MTKWGLCQRLKMMWDEEIYQHNVITLINGEKTIMAFAAIQQPFLNFLQTNEKMVKFTAREMQNKD